MAKKTQQPAQVVAAQSPDTIVDVGFPLSSGQSQISITAALTQRTCGGCRHLDRGAQSCRRTANVNEHSPICSPSKYEWDVANAHPYLNRDTLGVFGKLVFQQKTAVNTRNLAAVGAMLLQVASKPNVLALASYGLEPFQPVMFSFGRGYLSNFMPCYVLTATVRNVKVGKSGNAVPTTVFQLANIDTGAVYESLGLTDANCFRLDDWPAKRKQLLEDGLITDPLLERSVAAHKAWAFGRSAASRSKDEDEGRDAEFANALAEAATHTRTFELAAHAVLVRYSESVDTYDERGVVDALDEAAELCQNHEVRARILSLRNRFVRMSVAIKAERGATNRDQRYSVVEVEGAEAGTPWPKRDLLTGDEIAVTLDEDADADEEEASHAHAAEGELTGEVDFATFDDGINAIA